MFQWTSFLLAAVLGLATAGAQDFSNVLLGSEFEIIEDNMAGDANLGNGRVEFSNGGAEFYHEDGPLEASYEVQYDAAKGTLVFKDGAIAVTASVATAAKHLAGSLSSVLNAYPELSGKTLSFGIDKCDAFSFLPLPCKGIGKDAVWVVAEYEGSYYFNIFWTNKDQTVRVFRSKQVKN